MPRRTESVSLSKEMMAVSEPGISSEKANHSREKRNRYEFGGLGTSFSKKKMRTDGTSGSSLPSGQSS